MDVEIVVVVVAPESAVNFVEIVVGVDKEVCRNEQKAEEIWYWH